MSDYGYQQLHGVAAIRLLHVEPGYGSEPITCHLSHTSLTSKPIYEALSYTWGSTGRPQVISCDGYKIPVTRNLYAALVRFRLKDEPRVMWIDALCINQKDNNEKTTQIRLMGDIYKNAQRGLVWLGDESKDDRAAIHVLYSLKTFISWYRTETTRGTLHGQGRTISFETPEVHKKLLDLNISARAWGYLNQFFQRPWFSRVWIIQEAVFVANSPLPTLVVCGSFEITWMDLANVAEGIVSLGLFFLYGSGHLEKLGHMAICLIEKLRHSTSDSSSRRLLTMLNSTRESGATNPKDKVFALYGLLGSEEADSPLLLPDYTKNVASIYTDVAIYILRTSRSLNLLQSIPWTLPQHGGSGGISGLPSWVPDWSRRHAVPQLQSDMFHAGGRERSDFRIYEGEKVLAIRGKYLDCLETLMDPNAVLESQRDRELQVPDQAGQDQTDRLAVLREFAPRIRHKRGWYQSCLSACWRLSPRSPKEDFPLPPIEDIYLTGEPLQEAFWRTLICNMDMEHRKAGPGYRDHWLALHTLYSRFEDVVNTNLNLQQILAMMAFEEPMGLFAEGRRFCTTSNGFMGWVPQQAQLGDMLCVFSGSKVPFLLRRALFERNDLPFLIRPGAEYFKVIGECYVHGIMEGEFAGGHGTGWTNILLH
jgi:Heterokaryon incompatibility protein (HET)